MKAIGGYFPLELPYVDNMPHGDGLLVNSGRNALELVLRSIPCVTRVYIPYYTCDVVLEPFQKLSIPYTFYHLGQHLELVDDITLGDGEYILYTNYFGIQDSYILHLSARYGDKLIVDHAQALYAPATVKCIYSPRKFVGAPDGGIAYTDSSVDLSIYDVDSSANRCSHLLIRHDAGASAGYAAFRDNSATLKQQPIRQMSPLTRTLLSSIDFAAVRQRRIANFQLLHAHLAATNLLDIPSLDSFACPMVYPYLTDDATLKQRLIQDKIFVATYWPNVMEWCSNDDLEYKLATRIIPLPIDHRYGLKDMRRIIDAILG